MWVTVILCGSFVGLVWTFFWKAASLTWTESWQGLEDVSAALVASCHFSPSLHESCFRGEGGRVHRQEVTPLFSFPCKSCEINTTNDKAPKYFC